MQNSLSIEQQKRLYSSLYDIIIEMHSKELKNELRIYTQTQRLKGSKGIILLDYTNVKDMIDAVKNKSFFYEWIPKNDALKIKHAGIPSAILSMNPCKDCVLVCSLSLSLKHLYVDCMKFKDIDR